MTKVILLILIIKSHTVLSYSQSYHRSNAIREYSEGFILLKAGPAYLMGDAFGSPFERSFFTGENFNAGIGFKNKLSDYLAVSFELNYANYTNSDTHSRQHSIGFYSSRSKILKGIFRTELHLPIRKIYSYNNTNSIYLYTGMGGAHAKIEFANDGYMGKPISSTAIIPMGIGYSYAITNNLLLGIEFGGELSYSDYLDGYKSTNFENKFNDMMVNSTINIAFRLF